MFKGIRSRLIFSYIIVILVALAVAFLALILVSRPLQSRFIEMRLVSELSRISLPLKQELRRNFLAGTPLERLSPQLNNRLTSSNARVLILRANGQIVFDSQEMWTGKTIDLSSSARSRQQGYTSGRAIGPNNKEFIYAATPLAAGASGNASKFHLALISPSPRTTTTVLGDLWVGFLAAGLIAFFLAILLGLAIVRSVTKPLQSIAQAAESVAQGDYSQRVPQQGPTEIKRVALAFNSMTRQVQASQIAMQDFVSNVSHDLKTPLTSIQGFSQALLEGATQDEASRQRAATIIFDEATRMRRLVEELLDLARIDAGQITIDREPVVLTSLLKAILNSLTPQAAAKEILLVKDIDSLLTVVGNGDRLTQVFTNLIDNAIKHTPQGGQIRVEGSTASPPRFDRLTPSLNKNKRFAKITIADTGSGIQPEDMERIFERFYQVDKSRKQGQGLGLGLAIAHNIVKAHNGHIQVQSAPGQGTTFTVWLPTTEADISTAISRRK
ncbi:MAG TPA: HAMP domain-containing histidine kinase [Anaerolineae bacterium]|nr:HAMP domain-containing histidine kinase [Anaerolineae bacterium]